MVFAERMVPGAGLWAAVLGALHPFAVQGSLVIDIDTSTMATVVLASIIILVGGNFEQMFDVMGEKLVMQRYKNIHHRAISDLKGFGIIAHPDFENILTIRDIYSVIFFRTVSLS